MDLITFTRVAGQDLTMRARASEVAASRSPRTGAANRPLVRATPGRMYGKLDRAVRPALLPDLGLAAIRQRRVVLGRGPWRARETVVPV